MRYPHPGVARPATGPPIAAIVVPLVLLFAALVVALIARLNASVVAFVLPVGAILERFDAADPRDENLGLALEPEDVANDRAAK